MGELKAFLAATVLYGAMAALLVFTLHLALEAWKDFGSLRADPEDQP